MNLMTEQEIDFLKKITIDDVRKFYPNVIEDDFLIMKIIIEDDVLQNKYNFPTLIDCLMYVLEESVKYLSGEVSAMKSIHRDMVIDEILKNSKS